MISLLKEDPDELDLEVLDIKMDNSEIDKIDNNIKNKTTIRNAIKAGANCVKRGT